MRIGETLRRRRVLPVLAAVLGVMAGGLTVATPASADTATAPACGPAVRFGAMCYFYRSY